MVDIHARIERLDTFLADQSLEAVWFARPNGFNWLTGGNNVVDSDASIGVAAAGYDGSLRILTNNIEKDRLIEEEVPDTFSVESFPWHEQTLSTAIIEKSPQPAAADFNLPDFKLIDSKKLRQPLTDDDMDTYRKLGQEAAKAIETVCRKIEPGDTECDVAAKIRARLGSQNINAPVLLIAGADRAQKYRHYIPSDKQISNYVLVSVTAQRDGLYASMTRTVAFDPPEWLESRSDAAARIEATAIRATNAGIAGDLTDSDGGPDTSGDVFTVIRQAYDRVGFPDEWQSHHQGGAAGFAGREWVALPEGREPLRQPMAYAWNPTINGTKSENTHLITSERTESITQTEKWPVREFKPVDINRVPKATIELTVPLLK